MKKIVLSAFADEYARAFNKQISVLKAHEIAYIELRFLDTKNVSELTLEEARSYKKRLDEAGIKVSAIGSPLGKINLADDFDSHLEKTKHTCELAKIFDTKNIRMFSFYLRQGQSRGECRSEVLEKLARMIEIAESRGVKLCHENEAGIYGESSEHCLDLLEHFEGRLGCVFDMGNFLLDKCNPMVAYALLKPYVTYFHIKDALSAGAIVPAGKGEAEIGKLLKAYAAEGDGAVIATVEPHLQTFDGLNALVLPGKQFDNPYKFESMEDAFIAGVEATKALL